MNHRTWGAKLGIEYSNDTWDLEIDNGALIGSTIMNNFDMSSFLYKIGVHATFDEWKKSDYQCNKNLCKDCKMRFICYTEK
jgi:hypothetical protein